MVTVSQSHQELMEAGVGVGVGAGVEMVVVDSLDPTLMQVKTEVSLHKRTSTQKPYVIVHMSRHLLLF